MLTTECLTLIPNLSIYRTNESFILKTPQQKLHGDFIETDLYLNQIFI